MSDSFVGLVESPIAAETQVADFANPQIGESGTFAHELHDSEGKLVATAKGGFHIVCARPGDGAIMAYVRQDMPVVGTSGRFLGKSGFFQWHNPQPGTTPGQVSIVFFSSPVR